MQNNSNIAAGSPVDILLKSNKALPAFVTQGKDPFNPTDDTVIYWVFSVLLDSMSIRQQTVGIQSKELQLNADMQNQFNKSLEAIHFSQVPPGPVTPAELSRLQALNQQYSKMREDLINLVTTSRMRAGIEMSQANAELDSLQQDGSEDAGLLKTAGQIFQLIVQMNQGS